MHLDLDTLEFRTPAVELPTQDFWTKLKQTRSIGLGFSEVWQRRLRQMWEYVQNSENILAVDASRGITLQDHKAILLCSGTITLTLPSTSNAGDSYYFFNNDAGVITIAGTINGNAAGYQLVNQYQYVRVTSVNGLNWIITSNN